MNPHALPLHNVHVVLRAGVVAVQAQGSPEVGPQLAVARDQRADDFPAGEQRDRREGRSVEAGGGWAEPSLPQDEMR